MKLAANYQTLSAAIAAILANPSSRRRCLKIGRGIGRTHVSIFRDGNRVYGISAGNFGGIADYAPETNTFGGYPGAIPWLRAAVEAARK